MQCILIKVMNIMLLLLRYAHSAVINLTYVKFAFPLF